MQYIGGHSANEERKMQHHHTLYEEGRILKSSLYSVSSHHLSPHLTGNRHVAVQQMKSVKYVGGGTVECHPLTSAESMRS